MTKKKQTKLKILNERLLEITTRVTYARDYEPTSFMNKLEEDCLCLYDDYKKLEVIE